MKDECDFDRIVGNETNEIQFAYNWNALLSEKIEIKFTVIVLNISRGFLPKEVYTLTFYVVPGSVLSFSHSFRRSFFVIQFIESVIEISTPAYRALTAFYKYADARSR